MGGIEAEPKGPRNRLLQSTDASNGFNKQIKPRGLMRRLERRSAGWFNVYLIVD